MSDFASIVIIKRTGADGPRFPLRRNECLFGRNASCDLRVQLPGVALEHAKVSRSENREFYLENLSDSETMINGNLMKEHVELSNMDVFSIAGRSFRFEYEQTKRKSLGQKKLSLDNSGHLVSPLKETNRVVKDSPRNPLPRRSSLRESLGKLRRSSVPFQEVEEPVSSTPEKVEEQPKPLPRRASLRESVGKLRRSSIAFQEEEEPVLNTSEEVEDEPKPLPRRASLRESVGKLRRSSVAFQEEEEPVSNTPEKMEEQQLNPAMPTTKTYTTTPVSTKKPKKRVSFGPNLSPEQFDKTLPVSTPFRKGATPRRLSAPLLKPCISPARRRYSVAAPSFVSKIEEEAEESDEISDDEEVNHPKAESPDVEIVEVLQNERPKLATPLRAEIKVGKLRRSSVAFQEEEEPVSNTPEKMEEQQLNPAMPTTKTYTTTPVSTKKPKKRVSFGPNLSPEQFDKTLPVLTPFRKGATPRRLSAPLLKPCISPARRRYSVAAPSFVSKIEEEAEESDEISDDEEVNHPKAESPDVEIVEVLQNERPKLATPLRAEIKVGKKLRATNKKMATPLKNAIKQGFRLKATKKKLNTPLRKKIKGGKKLRPTRKRLNTPVRKAIEAKPKLRATRMRMPTPVRKAIEAKPFLRQTKRAMEEDLQDEIKTGKSLRQTKKVMPEPLQEEIKTGRKFLRIKRRLNSELQGEIMAGKELNVTKKKMAVELQAEIVKGVQFRQTRKRMPTMLQDEIKSGIELSKTKQSLKTPIRKEIESGVNLRKTKRRMATMLQDEIKSCIELSKTKQSLKTPIRKEIESGVNLRKTKRRMATMLQDEIKSCIELSKTKQSLKTPIRKEIESGVNLRKTKRRMATMLQDEIKSGIELSKTKQSLKTPIRKEIESGVNLRKTKRRMPTMLQNEIQSGIELSKTKQSLKTPIRKEIETGVKLRPTKPKDEEQPNEPSKTPKRRLSSVDDNAPQSTRKKLKTPSRTPQKAGFFPSTRSRTRSISRRKSTKKPSYAEIAKRPKLVAKRRLSTKQKNVFKFKAEQQVVSSSNATGSKADGTTMKVSKKNKTPSRRKSLARSKVFDGKTAGDWNVVVNKRKIKKIKRQRAVKPQQELDVEGVSSLFRTPKATHSQALVGTEKEETPIERPIRKCRMSSSPGDAVLYGIAKLMKTPKVKQNNEPDLEGVAELFEVLEMASPIAVSGTPSLRRASDRVSIVTPLPINKTPSLRMKESTNDVVFPLQLSSTPSLRKATENVALADEPLRTPSLRRVSESLTVAFAEEPRQTPSLRQGGKNLTVVAAETPKYTPSLKKAAEIVLVSSPLQASITPSLKNIHKIVAASPVHSTSPTAPTEIAKSCFTRKQSKTVAVVSPFPGQSNPPPQSTSPSVQSTASDMQPATVEPSLPQQTLPSDDLTSKPADEEPSTSKTTVAKRSTRSKRKVEPETLPAAKRPRTTSRNNTAKVVVETVESETELPNGRASTRSSKSAVTSHSQVQKRTRSRPAKQPPVSVLQQPLIEVVDLEEQAEDKVDSKSKRTTRARRLVPAEPTPTSVQPAPPQVQPTVEPSSTVQPILPSEDLTSKPPTSTDEEPKSKTRSTRSKCIVEPDILQAKCTRRTTSRNNRAKVVNEKETEMPSGRASTQSGKTGDKNSVTSESKLPKKTRVRSTKLPEKSRKEKVVDLEEQVENDVDSKSKRNTRASRRKPTNKKAKGQSNSKSNSTPKIPTRSRKRKNVAGIPETPQPLQFTKTKLETIIEVPTPLPAPASSLRGSSIKKSLLESQRSTQSRRDIITVIEELVEPVMPITSDERYVAEQETMAKGRVSRAKRTAAAEKSVGKSKESESDTVSNGKRATRAKRGIAVVVVEENLPAPKRQKKEMVEAGGEKVDDGKMVQQEKRGGRQTRTTAREEKVVEELTISNTRSTRRKKPAVKEIEIVEETVVKYTRTTRQRAKPVEESASVETLVEERGRRARKGNSGSQTIEEDSGSRRKTRTTRQKQGAVQENGNVEIPVEKEEVKSGRTRSKRTAKTGDNATEQVTRVTRSRRGAK